ncbi:MAG: response regulator [Melioribacteraceae bacterium]|nr:response regulator [Melioribacteraceae bacterium]
MSALSKSLSEPYTDEKKPKYIINTEAITKGTIICVIVLNDSPAIQEEIISNIQYVPNIEKIIVSTFTDFFEKHASKKIDIVITDIEFGNKVLTSIVKQIKAISPETDIIIYTRIDSPKIRTRLLKNGANAFVQLGNISNLLEHIVKIMVKKKYSNQIIGGFA